MIYFINAHLGLTQNWFAYEINIFQLSEAKMEINAGNSEYLNLCHALQHNLDLILALKPQPAANVNK